MWKQYVLNKHAHQNLGKKILFSTNMEDIYSTGIRVRSRSTIKILTVNNWQERL